MYMLDKINDASRVATHYIQMMQVDTLFLSNGGYAAGSKVRACVDFLRMRA